MKPLVVRLRWFAGGTRLAVYVEDMSPDGKIVRKEEPRTTEIDRWRQPRRMVRAAARALRPLPRAACVLVEQDGEYLAVPRRDGSGYGLPGGKCEPGETPEECAVRECAEETGVLVNHLRLICTHESEPGPDGVSYSTSFFAARIVHLPALPTALTGVEFGEFWVTRETLLAGPFGASLGDVFTMHDGDA